MFISGLLFWVAYEALGLRWKRSLLALAAFVWYVSALVLSGYAPADR